MWIYIVREHGLYMEFQSAEATKEAATLEIAEQMRISGYNVDMKEILQTIHTAPDENDNG
jgi:hypothetical protein